MCKKSAIGAYLLQKCLHASIFSPFPFLNTGKPKCFLTHLAGLASLHHSVLLYHFRSSTRSVKASVTGMHGLMVTVVPTSLCSALQQPKNNFFCPEDRSFETVKHPEHQLLPRYHEINNAITSLFQTHLPAFNTAQSTMSSLSQLHIKLNAIST